MNLSACSGSMALTAAPALPKGTRDKRPWAPLGWQSVHRTGLGHDPHILVRRLTAREGAHGHTGWARLGTPESQAGHLLLPGLVSTPWSDSASMCLCLTGLQAPLSRHRVCPVSQAWS